VNWIALVAQRRTHEFGLTREQLAQIALNARRNAADNPSAIYRAPMDMADYLDARMISTPLCLFDCDAPSDGSTALVVSHRDHAPDVSHPVCQVNAVGTALRGRPSWDQFDDMTTMAARDAAASMWERTDLRPADVDIAQLYDGFSILAMVWLEALGFCGRGESGPFVEDGVTISRTGSLPINTAGGQLSGGRLHGFGLIHEACVQLRGDGGDRQVVTARGGPPEVAAVSNGGGPIAGPAQRRILRQYEAVAHRAQQVGGQRLGLGEGLIEGDQRKAWQKRAQDGHAAAAAPCWTRHHDKNTPANSYACRLNPARRNCVWRKTSLMELKQLWLMTR